MVKEKEKEVEYGVVSTRHGNFKTIITRKWQNRKPWEPVNPKEVRSFIPGTVIELKVKEGQKVKEGDLLMVYRAMKMDNNILAEQGGKIAKIFVKQGDNLPNRALMMEYE